MVSGRTCFGVRSSPEDVFSTDNVGGKLVAVSAAVTTDVALEGLAETMATHVEGEHDVIQEEDVTVLTAESTQDSPLSVHHLDLLPGGEGQVRAPPGRRGDAGPPFTFQVVAEAGPEAGPQAGERGGRGVV